MSIKSLGKIAAIAAVAGLGLTACADGAANDARQQEETCGLMQAASTKATEAVGGIREASGGDSRAAFQVESAALDLRQHSFERDGELRNALQVQAAQFDDMAETLNEDVSTLQDSDPTGIEVDGMSFEEASGVIGAYCGPVFGQQQGGL